MKPLADCLLYAFVDSAYLNGRNPESLCHQLCEGGADLVQLRAKDWNREDVMRVAKRLAPITANAGVRLVINDHPNIAGEVEAPTAHLGQAGDRVTIMTFGLFDEKSGPNHKPRVIALGENTAIKEERNIG